MCSGSVAPRQSPDVYLCTNNSRAGTGQVVLLSSDSLCSVLAAGGRVKLRCQSWAVVAFSLLLKPFRVLLQPGMFWDASAANVGHSLTAGCTSSRVGRCQSWVCDERFRISLLCPSFMAFLKPHHRSGTLHSLCLLVRCISWKVRVGRPLQRCTCQVIIGRVVNQNVV